MNGPSVLPLGSDDGIESIVEPLHRYFHHLSQGVVLCAFVVLVANGLISEKQETNSLNTRKKNNLSQAAGSGRHPCVEADVDRLPVHPDGDVFVVGEIHTLLTKHFPKGRQRGTSNTPTRTFY